jgi:predicted DNA-binding transcriptional regulator AlpA
MSDLLGTRVVAEWIGVPTSTLRYWRHRGEGPMSFKLGPKRVAYDRADVEEWLAKQRALSIRGDAA